MFYKKFFNKKGVELSDAVVADAAKTTYDIITSRKSILELYALNGNSVVLLFDPFQLPLDGKEIIDVLISYYEHVEDYEKCYELLEIKLTITDGTVWIDELLWGKDL
jgi:hypothetical protein